MKFIKRCLLPLPAFLLVACIAVSYAPYPYAYQGPPVYVAPAPY